ncbi:MAG: oxygen-independent coproporphyrinogen III oxidase [Bacteroidetes bacterium]|nr:oxygen-independent coproporphyrinogen III oxidase [Bacteroidota bacterium]MBU1580253.1 oxygen-independent coproporphyrinogen III oxidase [Bacteroidota bacterium]MBU2465277.1 oxygen-independent coproporphyrinogen III oxidase [Bacteroidota bacterium]MBU2557996.1 oxygen-independent coproporphyrinogen III oxidase [Bacteroidota bacterium]
MNTDLIKKYNKAAPRYTSYPPANHFTEEVNSSNYEEAVRKSNSFKPQNISFYLHIPFCKKLCFYCGCNTCPMGKANQVKSYLAALKTELSRLINLLDKNRKVSQIHYGGGTPNAIEAQHLQALNQMIFDAFELTDDAEVAIETNPAYLDEQYLLDLKQAGFNRFSLGIQDFNKDVLRLVNRDPSAMPIADIMAIIKNGQPNNAINFDFIYGLPAQTLDSFAETIEAAAKLKPDRLVTFSYAHLPSVFKNQEILEKRGLSDSNLKVAMYNKAAMILAEAGYKAIGMDHFVLPNDELFRALDSKKLHRNFQGYCTRATTGQVYAVGVSAISQLEQAYLQNTKSVDDYIERISQGNAATVKGYELSKQEMIVREAITDLMCNKVLDLESLAMRRNISLDTLKNSIHLDKNALAEFEADNLLKMNANRLEITDAGQLFIRNIAASLDPLQVNPDRLYSKTI